PPPVAVDPVPVRGLLPYPSKLRTVGVGPSDVIRLRPVLECIPPPVRKVDELVAEDEVAGLRFRFQRPDRRRADDTGHGELLKRPEVCAIGDHVRGILVVDSVSGQERDTLSCYRGDCHGRARKTVRRLYRDSLRPFEESVEAGTAEDPDLGPELHVCPSVFSLLKQSLAVGCPSPR